MKASGCLGASMGMGVVLLLRISLTQDQLRSYGWRLPFIFSIILGALGIYYRSKLEPGDFEKHRSIDAEDSSDQCDLVATSTTNKDIGHTGDEYLSQLKYSLCQYYPELLVSISILSFWCVCYYSLFVWMQYFLTDQSLLGNICRHSPLLALTKPVTQEATPPIPSCMRT